MYSGVVNDKTIALKTMKMKYSHQCCVLYYQS